MAAAKIFLPRSRRLSGPRPPAVRPRPAAICAAGWWPRPGRQPERALDRGSVPCPPRRPPADRPEPLNQALAALRSADLYLAAACAWACPRRCGPSTGPAWRRSAACWRGWRRPGPTPTTWPSWCARGCWRPTRGATGGWPTTPVLGSLRRWVRTAAVRLALNQGRGVRELAISDEELAARLPDGRDAELSFLKAHYRPAFAAALREASTRWRPADQNLLRQRYVDGLSLEELGALQGVHRATALRRLERARQALLADLRARLRERLKLGSRELESLLRLVASRIDVTLGRRADRTAGGRNKQNRGVSRWMRAHAPARTPACSPTRRRRCPSCATRRCCDLPRGRGAGRGAAARARRGRNRRGQGAPRRSDPPGRAAGGPSPSSGSTARR